MLASGTITVEGWNSDGANYAIHTLTGGTTAALDFSGPLGFGRPPWAGGNLRAKVDWMRWRSAVGPTGVRPLDGDTDYNLLRWELDGNGLDSSPHGLNLTLSGSPAFENSP